MPEIKDRRITAKKKAHRQSAQSHGSDMVNGSAVGHSLPFVGEKEERYLNLYASDPTLNEETLNPVYTGGDGSTPPPPPPPPPPTSPGIGRPGYVALPPPPPPPPPVPTPPPPTFQGGGIAPPALGGPTDTGGGTTLPVATPPIDTNPPPAPLTPTGTPPTAPPTVVTTPATASPQPPVANAGPSQSITGSTANLDGSGSSDPQDNQLSFSWALVSGPNMPAINNPAGATTALSGLVAGSYVFKLTVTNALGLNNTSTTSITVTGPDNSGATVNTGVTTLNSGSTVLTTAPLGDSGLSPYGGIGMGGGGGGGGGSAPDSTAAAPESMWQKIWEFTKDHWWLIALVAAGTSYVLFKKDGKNDL